VRDSRHEAVLEGPQVEDAGRLRPRDCPQGGFADLRRLRADHQALAEAAHRETGGVEPKPVPGGPPARKGTALEAALPRQVSRNPDLTLEEHGELFYEEHGTEVSAASVSRALKKLGLPLKKSRP
jgi:hypothetical protein